MKEIKVKCVNKPNLARYLEARAAAERMRQERLHPGYTVTITPVIRRQKEGTA